MAYRQGDEAAPDAWLVFGPSVRPGIRDLEIDNEIIVLTWLHRARRDVLVVYPRDERGNPLCGVFNTRSSDRPNPIGLHVVQILAIDGTPIVDVKPVLKPIAER